MYFSTLIGFQHPQPTFYSSLSIFWTLYSLIQSPHIITSQPHSFLDGFHSPHSLFMSQTDTQRAHAEKGVEEKWANIELTLDYFRLRIHKEHNSTPLWHKYKCSGYLLTTWKFYSPWVSASPSSSIRFFLQHLQLRVQLNCRESVIRIESEMNGWVKTAVSLYGSVQRYPLLQHPFFSQDLWSPGWFPPTPSLPSKSGHVSYTKSEPHGLSLDGSLALISLLPKVWHE